MERILTYSISDTDNLKPIDCYLRSMGYSSQNIIELKKMPNSILVNGVWEHVTYKLHTNDVLTIHVQESICSPHIIPVPLPLSIIYEDEDILVVNKPANMPIHPSQNNFDNTLANAVMYYFANQHIPYVFRCINRLDRDTTGLTILAKHMISAGILSAMVQKRRIKREYTAIVAGTPEPAIGIINAPIGRVNGSTIERTIDYEHGDTAITHYKVLQKIPGEQLIERFPSISPKESFSLLSLWLETGRTHQIRVHLQSIGCPLIGDFLYHPDMRMLNRQALHSQKLTFCHPITEKELSFTAPLPDDMTLL